MDSSLVNIPLAKLFYLVDPKDSGDKSSYLSQIGFYRTNLDELESAIRNMLESGTPELQKETAFGTTYYVNGVLCGPGGVRVAAAIIIDLQGDRQSYNFVTIIPGGK